MAQLKKVACQYITMTDLNFGGTEPWPGCNQAMIPGVLRVEP